MMASEKGHLDVVDALLNHNATVDFETETRVRAVLHYYWYLSRFHHLFLVLRRPLGMFVLCCRGN